MQINVNNYPDTGSWIKIRQFDFCTVLSEDTYIGIIV